MTDLLTILRSDTDSTARIYAVRSLGNIFYQTYIHPFLERAAREELKVIRAQFGYNLPARAEYEEYDERGHDIVSVELRGGDERIIRAIGEAATNDAVDDVRRHAARTLRGLKHQSGRSFLDRAKSDSAVDVRQIAAEALGELNSALGQFPLGSA